MPETADHDSSPIGFALLLAPFLLQRCV